MKVILKEQDALVVRDQPDQVVIISQSGPPGAPGGGGGGGVTDGDKGDIVVSGTGTIWTVKTTVLDSAGAATMAAHLANPDPHPQYALDTDLAAAVATREPVILPGTTSQYWRGDKTWQTLDKTSVGLGNVDNTADLDKPVSTAQAASIAAREPAIATGTTNQYWRGDKTWQILDKASVGLGNVDNTADLDKPVSTAQQLALNAKADLDSPTFTGTVSGITKAMVGLGNVDNTADLDKPVSTAQAAAIATREPAISAGTTSQYWRGDKTWQTLDKTSVGLGNVDNTADADKPVSTAQAAAIATREPAIATGTTSQYWRGDKTWQTLDKASVGLGNVDNTADADKPVFTATVRGLVPASGGGTTNFLRADGAWAAPPGGGGGGGSPGGTTGQVQFNNAGTFAGSPELVIGADGTPALGIRSFNDAAPTPEADLLKLFTRNRAGRSLLSVMGPSGRDIALQTHLGLTTVRMLKFNFSIATVINIGFATVAATGISTTCAYNNATLFQRVPRFSWRTQATAGSQCGLRTVNGSTTQPYLPSGREGYFVVARFGLVKTSPDRQLFVGLHPNTASLPVGEPSTSLNSVCLGMDSTDTNLQIMHNDDSGIATKIDLGPSFPAPIPNQDFYELRLFQAPGSLDVGWYVENLDNGNKAHGLISTKQPVLDARLSLGASLINGATNAVVQIAINSFYVETDF